MAWIGLGKIMVKPFRMLKELAYYRQAIESGLVPGAELRFVNWYLIHSCDLACHYCKVPNYHIKVMDRESRVEALSRLKSLCVKRPIISILGGEPTLHPDLLLEAVRDASEAGFLVNVVSNGWGLTPDLIKRLGKSGLHYLGVSVDCDEGAEKTNLSRAFELHKTTKRQGIIPVVNTVITAETDVATFKRFGRNIIENRLFFSPLACSPEVPQGMFSSATKDSVPTRQQLREIVPWLAWLKLKSGYVTASFSYLWTLFKSGRDDLGEVKLWHCSEEFRRGTGRKGRGYITMDSDGFIGTCQEFPRLINLLDESLDQLKLEVLDALFAETSRKCPGCLHNCYVMEEEIRGAMALAESATLIRMASIKETSRMRPLK